MINNLSLFFGFFSRNDFAQNNKSEFRFKGVLGLNRNLTQILAYVRIQQNTQV